MKSVEGPDSEGWGNTFYPPSVVDRPAWTNYRQSEKQKLHRLDSVGEDVQQTTNPSLSRLRPPTKLTVNCVHTHQGPQ